MGVLSNNRAQIVSGGLISASFVSDVYDVLTGNSLEDVSISGSLTITGSLIADLTGTASTASYVELAQTASYVENAVSSSYAVTASYAENANISISSSYAETASYSVVTLIDSASLSDSASYAFTASYVETAQTASYVELAQTASYVENAVSASYAPAPAPEYKVYSAMLRQSGTGAPTERKVFKNTLTNSITFSRVSTGVYSVTCADITGVDATTTNAFVLTSGIGQGSIKVSNFYGGYGTISVYNHLAAGVDNYLLDLYFELRIY